MTSCGYFSSMLKEKVQTPGKPSPTKINTFISVAGLLDSQLSMSTTQYRNSSTMLQMNTAILKTYFMKSSAACTILGNGVVSYNRKTKVVKKVKED